MAKTYVIEGKKPLKGEVNISGSKNCALCLIAGALLTKEKVILNNIPNIEDIRIFIRILNYLNVKTNFDKNTLTIDSSQIINKNLNIEEVGRFRASYYLIGALINKFKHLEIANFGGCNFVKRPINYHLDLLKYFGADYKEQDNGFLFNLISNEKEDYTLPYPSFGATINALLFAVSSSKNIVLKNICLEVEILHFIEFLKELGAKIILENNNIYISPSILKGTIFNNIPDRIETGTFLLMGPHLASYLKINNVYPKHNQAILDLFSLLDVKHEIGEDFIIVYKTKINKSCFLETGICEKLSSDLQPLLSVFCLNIPRISIIREKVYPSRFTHIAPLQKMGALISETNHNILINGIMTLIGTEITACDLRMAAAMIYAGLCAEGKTTIAHAEYIDRGYENIVDKLKKLGAEIKVYE